MPIYGVSPMKTISFRGVAQNITNTYFYRTPSQLTQSQLEALLNIVVNKEKGIFSATVNFVRGRLWSADGTKAENSMLVDAQLSGTGLGAGALPGQDRERAFLVRFRAGSDTRGRPVYLRKWWHLNIGSMAATNVGDSALANTAQLPQAIRTELVAQANGFKSFGVDGTNCELVAESGRAIDGPTVAHPYLEHRQLGDQWRG